MDFKTETEHFYNARASAFKDNTEQYLYDPLLEDMHRFISALSGPRALDIGSGPGRDAAYMQEQGLSPVCIDIAPGMVQLCNDRDMHYLCQVT